MCGPMRQTMPPRVHLGIRLNPMESETGYDCGDMFHTPAEWSRAREWALEYAKRSGVPELRDAGQNLSDAEANLASATRNVQIARRNHRVALGLIPVALFTLGAGTLNLWNVRRTIREHPAPIRTTSYDKDKMRTVTLDCPAGFALSSVFTDPLHQEAALPPEPAELDEALTLATCRKEGAWERRTTEPVPTGGHRLSVKTLSPEQQREFNKMWPPKLAKP
jgi:hypothetical protein